MMPFAGPDGLAAWTRLAADLLDDVAAVHRSDPDRQVVAVAADARR